jgi:hypothetical protein
MKVCGLVFVDWGAQHVIDSLRPLRRMAYRVLVVNAAG